MTGANGRHKGHVLLAGLRYEAKTADPVTDSVERACFELHEAGYLVTPAKKRGTADMGDNRNAVVSQFYVHPEFSHVIMYDQDVSWEMGTIPRLVSHPVDLVLGIYPKRVEGQGYPLKTLPGPVECVDPVSGKPKTDGLIRIAGGPGGLMCISRGCAERMITAYAERWYASKHVPGGKVWSLFEFEVIDHDRISEDMNFCRMWRAIGGEVWCDPHLLLHHHGDKAYSGRLVDHLREIGRLVEPGSTTKIAVENPASLSG